MTDFLKFQAKSDAGKSQCYASVELHFENINSPVKIQTLVRSNASFNHNIQYVTQCKVTSGSRCRGPRNQ